jgi:hypothetical protein
VEKKVSFWEGLGKEYKNGGKRKWEKQALKLRGDM